MLKRFLTRDQEELLSAERTLLQQLGYNLTRLEASREDTTRLDQARRQLDELFLLVIVGEFNAGKSAFINALLGQQLLEEGATPTTVRVHLLRHGDQIGRSLVEADMEVVTAPVEWLREINVVDTPGTNAVIQRHQEITEDFVPRSDLVLFVTSADRPFSESERLFMERIRAWGKKVVIVVNKVDILNPADVSRVRAFVAENALKLLGVEPEIFMVSARLARKAKEADQQGVRTAGQPSALELWAESRFEPLERYILDTLDETERLRLKLLSPLGVAAKLHAEIRRHRANPFGYPGRRFHHHRYGRGRFKRLRRGHAAGFRLPVGPDRHDSLPDGRPRHRLYRPVAAHRPRLRPGQRRQSA